MAFYSCGEKDGVEIIEIDFGGVWQSEEIRERMKSVKYRWNPEQRVWWAYKNEDTFRVAKDLCGMPSNDTLIKELKRHRNICWYPSANSDLRPLLYLSKPYYDRCEELSGESTVLPDLFLLTDYGAGEYRDYAMLPDRYGEPSWNGNPMCIREKFSTMWKQTLKKGDILFEDHATSFRVIDVRKCKLCDIEPVRDLITRDVSQYYGQYYCMTIEVDSHHNKKLGRWETDVIYVNTENTAFAKKILLQNHINLSHIVLMRYGGSMGGGSEGSYGRWLFSLAGPLNVKYYITDRCNESREPAAIGEKIALEYLRDGLDLDIDEYELTPIYECEWYNDEPAVWRKVEMSKRPKV